MAVELKNAADRCKLREKEDRVAQKDLKKVTAEAKDTRSAMRAMKEELRQAGDIMAGKPYMLRMKFGDSKYASLDRKWRAGWICNGEAFLVIVWRIKAPFVA